MKICISVQAQTNDGAQALMSRAYEKADLVELRIDGMTAPDLERLIKGKKGEMLVTSRRREEGGLCDAPERERVSLLAQAVMLGADYVDVEASTDADLIMTLKAKIAERENRSKLILSWHEVKGTPSERFLRQKYREMAASGADIIKMVTCAREEADNLRVLNLVPRACREEQNIIAFCMGGPGRLSRVVSPLLGSCFTYASLESGAESAPGQLTVDQMKKIWDIMTL